MVSGHGQKENAIECINRGATDFFTKPIDLDDLKVVINRAIHIYRLEVDNKILQSQLYSKEKFENIIGSSEQMQKLFQFIKTVAENDYTVLITGESGTGKELVARAIHKRSKRRSAPFVAINCGAIPENLLESELFGYEKGAFTDAKSQKIGKFEQAVNGTIFLDEIGEMTLKLQVKLLRFLEDRRIERVGGTQLIELDVRIIAATNQDLEEHAKSGKFREDLFYRLSVLHKELPPLRERGEDIIFLSNYFLDRFGKDNKRKGLKLSSEAIQAIDTYKWPGNVRELENKIKRAVILSQNKNISPQDLNLGSEDEQDKPFATLQEVRECAEMEHLKKALVAADWNISKVSRDLATSRTTLYELMEKYQLKKQ